jgi:hypothetical protein
MDQRWVSKKYEYSGQRIYGSGTGKWGLRNVEKIYEVDCDREMDAA